MLFLKLLTLMVLAVLTVSIGMTSTYATDSDSGVQDGNGSTTSDNVNATTKLYKFDVGFYQKIQDLTQQQTTTRGSDSSTNNGTRYYDTIIVVVRDGGDGIGNDEVARENKDAIVEKLKLVDARNISPGTSLSFVTASIPVDEISNLSTHDEIYKLGDGELEIHPNVDTARGIIHATAGEIATTSGRNLNGSGVTVAVLDTGIRHDDAFDNQTIQHVECFTASSGTGLEKHCLDKLENTITSDVGSLYGTTTHGTKVAQVIAASGLGYHNGIAPGVNLLDVITVGNMQTAAIPHALDYAHRHGADVVNMSFTIVANSNNILSTDLCQNSILTNTLNLIINEAVDRGMVAVSSAGNAGSHEYESITNPGCTYNTITVGGIDTSNINSLQMYATSSRGPSSNSMPIMKPEIVAPAVGINVLRLFSNDFIFMPVSGTSFSAPQVSAASALLLQLRSDFTPVDVKATLLIGANWTGPVPCTASEYENGGTGLCSHDYQPISNDLFNGQRSLSVLNNVGFGILDVSQSLVYANSSKSHVVSAEGESIFYPDQMYRIHADQGEQVKVIMSWLFHPRGSITDPLLPIDFSGSDQIHNYDIAVVFPDGTRMNSNSVYNTNEFVVFEAPEKGHYIIVVSSANNLTTTLYEPYALASTHEIETGQFVVPAENHSPTLSISADNRRPSSGDTVTLTATVSDPDNDSVTVSWGFDREDIDVDLDVSADTLTATFVVPYHDSDTTALYLVTATATDEHQASSSKDDVVVVAGISPNPSKPTTATLTDDFQSGTSSWTLSGNNDWETGTPQPGLSGQPPGNKVLTSNDCDSQCIISLNSNLDTSSPLTITFDRFVDINVRGSEGLHIQYSTDNTRWTTLASYTHNNRQDTNEWEEESLTLDTAQSTASLRFVAKSSHASEFVEMDNVSISPRVADTTSPTFTYVPPGKTFEATGVLTPLTISDIETATADDMVDPNPTVTSNIPQSFEFGIGTTIITWTATDLSGNSDTATQIITVQDTTSPDITAPADVSFTTTDTSIALTSADYGTATATDLVDPSPTITSNAPPSFRADHTTTITWTATDDYGNSAQATQSVTVMHSSLRIFVPADITVEAEHVNNTINIGTANATHDTDTNLTISNNATTTSFQVGTTTILWTVVDSIGVTVTDTQRITVQDTTDPILYSVPDLDFVFEIDIPIIINYDYPVATDLADDSVDVACTPASGTIFNENTTVVTCTATDNSGNTANITFNVDVVVFDPNIFSDNFEDGNMDGWTVTDHVETWAAVPLEENVYPPGHASTNKVAEVIFCDITCSMTTSGIDLSGHDDPIFLQFYRYADSSLDNDSYFQVETYNGSSWVVFDKWVPDNFHHDDAWHLEQYSLSDYTHVRDFGMRFTAYMESSSESVGIDDVRVFFVPEQVSDGTVPVIVPPVSIVAEAAGALTTVDIGNAIATPATNTTISNDAPTSFPLGSTTVTWTATDSSDNSDTATQRITIQDTTPPDITAPADVSFTITGTSIALTASDYGASTATDLIDSSPTITDNAPDLFPLGNTTITWTATDDYGNSAQATQQVTVILSSLMITAPADITAEATGTLTTVDIGNAIATHDTDTNITITNDAPLSFRVGTTTVITWTATDSVNDVVTDTQRITVQDTTNPVFSSVTDLDFIFEPGVPLAINYDSPTATDSVNGSVDVTCAPASGTVFSGGTTGVTCTAADNSGNTADITFNVDVLVLSTTIFLDDFEDRRLDGWTVTDYSDTWDSYPQESGVNPPDHPSTNKVAQVSWCDITCTMSITGFDLSGNAYPEFLQFYRYVDDTLDNGEYLLLEVYDGSSWTELDRWTPEDSDDDDAWHLEEYSLADYTEVTDFGMRFTTVMSSLDEAVAIDDVKIFIVP